MVVAPDLGQGGWVGRELGGYQVRRELGQGGMGVVFLAEHRLLGRRVAIKVIRPEMAADASFEHRFHLEARAISQLDHPGIVKLFDFALAGRVPYMVMELVAGRNLDELLRERGPMSPAQAVELFRAAAEGLDHAHVHGVVHRDIKPANILMTDGGRTVVTDFGLACLEGFTAATDPEAFLGSPDYIAPEQVAGEAVDGRADVYSFAAVIYECVTGARPFTGSSWIEVASRRLLAPPPLAFGVPDDFARTLAWAMSREPDRRPALATQLLDALARVLRSSATA